ncbi:hypothetical protein GGU11DRAFT_124285 [Lentinula aff. detonsa]|nr:hypothetical protein GGU11DRAFT_124285 [Lentinula aff. detonsa]
MDEHFADILCQLTHSIVANILVVFLPFSSAHLPFVGLIRFLHPHPDSHSCFRLPDNYLDKHVHSATACRDFVYPFTSSTTARCPSHSIHSFIPSFLCLFLFFQFFFLNFGLRLWLSQNQKQPEISSSSLQLLNDIGGRVVRDAVLTLSHDQFSLVA